MLIVGPNAFKHEAVLVLYLSLHSRNMFLRVFFTRTFVMGDELRRLRTMIQEHEKDPTTVNKVRDRLSKAAREIILMKETLGYMADSLVPTVLHFPPEPTDLCGKELHKILGCRAIAHNLAKRVRDLQKNIEGCSNELSNLTRMTDVINTKQLEDVYRAVEKNTKALVDASAAKERASASLEIMQIVFAASMAFDLIDKFTALDLNIGLTSWQIWIQDYLIHPPGVWFLVNMSWCFFMCAMLKQLMNRLNDSSLNFLTFEVVLNREIDVKQLKEYLETRELEVSDASGDKNQTRKSAIWEEDDEVLWEGAAPKMEISYDATNGFLLTAGFTIDRKNSNKSETELRDIFISQLEEHGAIVPPK